MPCRDYTSSDEYDLAQRNEQRRRLDLATRVACEAFHQLSDVEIKCLSKEAQDWWVKHQEADRRRLAAEREEQIRQEMKKRALRKLTAEERKVLGLRNG